MDTSKNGSNYELLAFFVPCTYRISLEAIAFRYPIGYDTCTFYLYYVVLYNAKKISLIDFLQHAPLYYWLLIVVSRIIEPILTIKLLAIIINGLFGYALYRFYNNYIEFAKRDAFEATMLTYFYFVILRLTWDLHRNVLGLILALLALETAKRGKLGISCALAFLAGLTHQLTLPFLVAFTFLNILSKRDRKNLFVTLSNFSGWIIVILFNPNSLLHQISSTPRFAGNHHLALIYPSGIFLLLFIIWSLGPILLPSVILVRKQEIINLLKNPRMSSAFSSLLLLSAAAFTIVLGYRLVILSAIPAVLLSYSIANQKGKVRRLKIVVSILAVSYTIAPLLGGLTIYPIVHPTFANWGPYGMLMGSLNIEDLRVAESLFLRAKRLLNNNTAVIVNYPLIVSAYRAGLNLTAKNIIVKSQSISFEGVLKYALATYNTVFIVWFHPNATFTWMKLFNMSIEDVYEAVPIGYKILARLGRMALYEYNQNDYVLRAPYISAKLASQSSVLKNIKSTYWKNS